MAEAQNAMNQAFEAFWERIEEGGYEYEDLEPRDRPLFLVHYFIAEVCNGGLFQFLDNSFGDYVPETLAAMRQIGFDLGVKTLERALDEFPNREVPRDRVTRMEQLAPRFRELKAAFEPIEDTFYEWSNRSNDDPIQAYIRANPVTYGA